MKNLIFLFFLFTLVISVQAQQKSKSNLSKVKIQKNKKKDSIPLFYGLTAKKILSLTVPEGKALIKKKKITVSQYFIARSKAKIYLSEEKIKKDSIETMKIYDRIEKKLGVKKNE